MYELNEGGRPSKLNTVLVAAIELGGFSMLTIKDTCVACDITYQTYLNYRKQAKEAMNEEGEIQDKLLNDFFIAHEKGKIKRKAVLIKVCLDSAMSDPDMALKLLERKFPDFSNRIKQEIEVHKQEIAYNFDDLPFEDIEAIVLKAWKQEEEEALNLKEME